MKKIFIFLFFIFFSNKSFATIKNQIIENLNYVNNLSFEFEQNINGKIENGKCTIEYPKKIFCNYDSNNKKILVSNGKSLVIKTATSYYIYPIEKTPLNFILDKSFLINKIKTLNERVIDEKFVNFNFFESENEINIFFDKKTLNLIGWQTLDIYQNLSITYINAIRKNQKLEKKLFSLPTQN
tara:strand:- start:475 stop:1023 length:549 start_codon:yes stop_codon:yes gene_type:complete